MNLDPYGRHSDEELWSVAEEVSSWKTVSSCGLSNY